MRLALARVRRGEALARVNSFAAAAAAYSSAILLAPELAEAHFGLGGAQMRLRDYEAACGSLLIAAGLQPLRADIQNRLGTAMRLVNRLDDTTDRFRRAIALSPGSGEALNNLGDAYQARVMDHEAVACYRQALAVLPRRAGIHSNLATADRDAGRLDAAQRGFNAALAIDPDHPGARLNLGTLALLRGDYRAGWEGFEWRHRANGFEPTPDYLRTQWTGGEIGERTIFVHADHGLGDVLQFARFIPPLARRSGRVVLRVPEALRRTLSGLEAHAEIIGQSQRPPPHHLHSPLLSLPRGLGTTLDTIPTPEGYLEAEPGLVDSWRRDLATLPRPRVGLVWAAGTRSEAAARRSLNREALGALVRDVDVSWVCLQLAPQSAALAGLPAGRCLDLSGCQPDMAETAAIVANLDLVITVDTAVAHLAGALGRPVWIMLPHIPDWRWMTDRPDSPWYRSARLFRQARPGDWASVVASVRQALAAGRA